MFNLVKIPVYNYMITKKCMCINNKHISMSPNLPLLTVGRIYEYYILSDYPNFSGIVGNNQLFVNNVLERVENENTAYFNQFFIDMEEYRSKQIDILVND